VNSLRLHKPDADPGPKVAPSAPPAQGTARWLSLPYLGGRPLLEIEVDGAAKTYELSIEPPENLPEGSRRPLKLTTLAGAVYYVEIDEGRESCTCSDARYRRRGCCKHICALKKLLGRVEF
jgi:hypothetical protein